MVVNLNSKQRIQKNPIEVRLAKRGSWHNYIYEPQNYELKKNQRYQ